MKACIFINIQKWSKGFCGMTRHEERELLMALIYEIPFYGKDEYNTQYECEKAEREISSEYIDSGVLGITENLDVIDRYISESAKGWKLSRLSKITLAILRVAVYEMALAGLPYTIAIDEAVILSGKYDDEKAPAFVNGILNNIAEVCGLKNKEKNNECG